MNDKPLGPFGQAVAAAANREKEQRLKNEQPKLGMGFTRLIEAGKSASGDITKKFPALVARVNSDYTLTINRGWDHNVAKGDRFLVYSIDPEELIDPETGESLGHLEIIRGTGVAVHVQQKMTTIESNRYANRGRTIRRQSGAFSALGGETIEEPEQKLLPFDSPEVGDKVKPTN